MSSSFLLAFDPILLGDIFALSGTYDVLLIYTKFVDLMPGFLKRWLKEELQGSKTLLTQSILFLLQTEFSSPFVEDCSSDARRPTSSSSQPEQNLGWGELK